MRRAAPVLAVGLLFSLLLASYVLFTRHVAVQLRGDAAKHGRIYARVFAALADPREDANAALLDAARYITELGVPVVVTDAEGQPTAAANLPFEAPLDDPRVAEYAQQLARLNPPVVEPGVGTVYFGDSALITSLRIIPLLQAALLALVFVAGVYVLRTRSRADRERVWAGMARESAHQLATPLSSLSGWLELLGDQADGPVTSAAVTHMRGDMERLERVAHRFERIGRPPRREQVDIGELAERTAAYFRARVPTLAHRVEIRAAREPDPLIVLGDGVLLEWAMEVLATNALDALAGRGGTLEIRAERIDPEQVRVRIRDDGPGIPRELRSRIFEAGFSTKQSGWGIGLSLARRIVEENHRGRLVLAHADRGATFDIILEG